MSRPRVAYILGSLAANDLGDEIVTILAHLSRTSFDPCVINLGGREDLKRRLQEMKVETHSLGLVGPIGTWRAVSRARATIRRLRPRLVHGYGSWGGSVTQLATPKDLAVVRTVTRAPNHERDLKGRMLRFLEGQARSRVHTRFVVPNEGSIGLALRAYGAVEGHVSVLPTSVDVGEVRDRARRTTREGARDLMGIEPADIAVVLVTGFDSGARMDQLLSGIALAVGEMSRLRFFMVGSGRYEGSTRWKAEELGLDDSVGFLGRGSEAGPVWAAADLAIDATGQSSWSRAGLIAIAAGLPTVKVQEGVSGWSEDLDEHLPMVYGEPERFASDVVRLASDAELREEIAAQGRRIAEEVDVAGVAERLGALYRELID